MENTFSNHWFSGDMLVFRGVLGTSTDIPVENGPPNSSTRLCTAQTREQIQSKNMATKSMAILKVGTNDGQFGIWATKKGPLVG